jgi:hypothetical protein
MASDNPLGDSINLVENGSKAQQPVLNHNLL